MKTHGILFKNIAACLMVLAVCSLLLPFCKITTPDKTASVSGYELVKAGVRMGLEYHENGNIEDDYVVKGDMTWSDLKSGVNYAIENENLREAEAVAVFSILPILFCILAIILTFLAIGKKTMIPPTLLIALAFFENIFLIIGFRGIQNKLFADMGSAGISLTLLIGIYAFTILCGIAFLILMILWITGSFNKPESDDDTSANGKKDKKDRGSRRNRRSRGRRKKKKSSRKKKKSGKDKNDKSGEDSQNDKDEKQDDSSQRTEAAGRITGQSGIYQGTDVDLTQNEDGTFTLGTTPEDVSEPDIDRTGEDNCVIQYHSQEKRYTVTSHAQDNILLKTGDGKLMFLSKGETKEVAGGTILQVGNSDNRMKLD